MLWLGLDLTGRLPPEQDADAFLGRAAKWFEKSDRDKWWRAVRADDEEARELRLHLHPAEEPAVLRIADGKTVHLQARTVGAGPGYHECLIELLDSCAFELGLRLDWSAPGADPTGYHASRDGDVVRRRMIEWLQDLARHLLASMDAGDTDCTICFPGEAPMPADRYGVRSPMGWWTRRFWEQVLHEETAEWCAESFFPWYHPERKSIYYRNRALVLFWSCIRWRPPQSHEEADLYSQAAQCVLRASQLDPNLPLPWRETVEALDLLGAHDEADRLRERADAPPEGDEAIGFYRHPQTYTLFDLWSLVLPGDMNAGWENEERVFVFGEKARTGRISAWPVERPRALGETPAAELFPPAEPEAVERVRWQSDETAGYLDLYPMPEEPERLILQGYLHAQSAEALLTFALAREDDRPWAEQMARSLKPLPAMASD